MTFDEWADQHDLMSHERRLCKEYLIYLRAKELLRMAIEVMTADEPPKGVL